MSTFSHCSVINCQIEMLYGFHLDTNNVVLITPPDTKVEILEINLPLTKGSKIKLKATKFFIPQIWEVEIEEATPYTLVVDKAISSPFKKWRHQHIFEKIDENSAKMCDVVEYELPFGVLGKLVAPLIKMDIKKMFEYRHKKTKEILEVRDGL